MKNTKLISVLIFLGVIAFALLDSYSSLQNETKSLTREISSHIANTNKMASLISKMPALSGAIEFQSFNQLDVVIENMFTEDSSIKSFFVLDHRGTILHSKSSEIVRFTNLPADILATTPDYTYHFAGEKVFISKQFISELNLQPFFIIFSIDYGLLLKDRLTLLSLPSPDLSPSAHRSNSPELDFLNIDSLNLWVSYLQIYLKKNIFRLSAIVLILMFLAASIVRLLISPIREIILSLKNIFNDAPKIPSVDTYPKIFRPIIKNIIDANLAIKEASRKQMEADILRERNEAVSKTAKKVAHDIRSPLTSLEFIVKNIGANLAEKERIIAHQALERISDILRTLGGKKTSDEKSDTEVEIIDPLVKRIISEKRLEFKHKNNIEIRLFNNLPYGTFVKISKADFYRTMSNLINNSAEAALPNKKLFIDLFLSTHDGECLIMIKDNGKGIPKEVQARVLLHGVSFGKETGSGIGLSSARETIENHNGTLVLQSEEGLGTEVTIRLPIGTAPGWFKTSLNLSTSNICIVDDDDSIHSVWDEILSGKNLSIAHLKSSHEFEEWLKEVDPKNFAFLFDLELLGSKLNGLELIEKHNLEDRSTLVTSHYDDIFVQRNAQRLGVKILPKDSAINISIDHSIGSGTKMVLIDDDTLVHMMWKMTAVRNRIDLTTYFSIDDFLKDAVKFTKDIAIYIDSELKDGIKGEIESKKIFDFGFKNLHLASGSDFDELPFWIKGNQSKLFPLTLSERHS